MQTRFRACFDNTESFQMNVKFGYWYSNMNFAYIITNLPVCCLSCVVQDQFHQNNLPASQAYLRPKIKYTDSMHYVTLSMEHRDVSAGQTVYPFWWPNQTNVMQTEQRSMLES